VASTTSVVVATLLAVSATTSSALGMAAMSVVYTTLVETAVSTWLTEIAGSS